MPSRSEYILLIVSRLGPPSVYDYWLAGYSLIISQKSITTSERMPEKINDLAAAETRNEVGSSRDATRRHCSILLRQSQSMTKKAGMLRTALGNVLPAGGNGGGGG